MTKKTAFEENSSDLEKAKANVSRRKFLNYAGAATGLWLFASSCEKAELTDIPQNPNPGPGGANNAIDLGSGDVGILNYAYALEQLEAAFYVQVLRTPYGGITANERAMLADIRNHEIAHREFFKSALGNAAIPALSFDFSSINFNDRNTVLATSKTFEDLGVSAYNGAGQFLQSADFLTVAGKIVSVEARHAAAIRDLIQNGSFAGPDDQIMNGLDKSRTPKEVLPIAATFIKNTITANNLPA